MFSADPLESADEAGLRYVDDTAMCIRRVRWGKSFRYLGPDGRTVREDRNLSRIRALAIPPAWTDVRICRSASGHLQAIGRDAKGRKQYRYHAHYREVRDQAKFSRMIAFGTTLALIRQGVQRDLERRGLPREKVLATVVRLLETTFIRVGNDEYARDNESLALTYSSLPTRRNAVCNNCTTAASTFSLGSPRRAISRSTACRIFTSTVPNAIMRLNFAWSRTER